jgi:hypothetical protein
MTDLNTVNFKTGSNVSTDVTEIHTAVFDVLGTFFPGTLPDIITYAHITPSTTRIGTLDENYENGEPFQAIVSTRSVNDSSFVDFDISLNDGSFNLLIRPQGGDAMAVSEPSEELITSYVREGTGISTPHMMSSVGCLNTYTRTSFRQMFRAEETGVISTIRINEDFVKPDSTVGISIYEMNETVPSYAVTDISAGLLKLDDGTTENRERFVITDISCITFDVSGAGFSVSQNSLYMMTFDGSFCAMGLWGEGMSMRDMDVSGDGYVATKKQPYPIEVAVKSNSISGKTDSGSLLSFASDVSGIYISPETTVRPYIQSICSGGNTYDVIIQITDVSGTYPHPPQRDFMLLRIDCCGNDISVEGVRKGSYENGVVATNDQLLARVDGSTVLLLSYFNTETNEFKLVRCSVDDLLNHPSVFNDDGTNPNYQDAVGANTSQRFVERLEAIGRSAGTKQHTIPYDGEPNSGMRMACDVSGDDHWVVYTDLRYATNTDAFVYMVNMSATNPDDTLIQISLRNPLPQADLSYRYFIATFPTISICGGGSVANTRYVSVGRHVYAYDTRANTMTFVSADISVYRVNVITGSKSYVGTVDADGTDMPGFSQYMELNLNSPHLHYTVTDVSGTAWGAKELKQSIGGVDSTVPLNNHHMFQDKVLYDISNSVMAVRWCDVSGSTITDSTPFHADVSGNLNVTGDCYANKFVARHTDANSVVVNHSLWANRVEAASVSTQSISIGGVELTATQLQALVDGLGGGGSGGSGGA